MKRISVGVIIFLMLITGCAPKAAHSTATHRVLPAVNATGDIHTQYAAWYATVKPEVTYLGSAKVMQTPADCQTMLDHVRPLDSAPLPPIDPADWAKFIVDTETGLIACTQGDTATMAAMETAFTEDTGRWSVAVATALGANPTAFPQD